MPNWKKEIRERLSALQLPPTREEEIVEELAQHVQDRYEELLAGGATDDAASRAALGEFIDTDLLTRELRPVEGRLAQEPVTLGASRKTNMIADFWQDVRYGLRTMKKAPAFTAIVVITLAMGIGANTAIFNVVNVVLLRPLPFRDPDRIITLWDQARGGRELGFTAPEFFDLHDQNHVFEDLAAYQADRANLNVGNEPERIAIVWGSAELFPVLGVQPEIGRVFSPAEDQPGSGQVVVLSHSLWQRSFALDREVIGKTVILDGTSCTVIGVMPRSFQFPDEESQLWIPLSLDRSHLDPGDRSFNLIARLKPALNIVQAKAELNAIVGTLQQEYPKKYPAGLNVASGVNLVPLKEWIVGDLRLPLLILFAAVGFVLLISCANVANMLLARAEARQKEIAIRLAVGAARMRLVRQLLTESLLLAMTGGVIGLLLSLWGVRSLLAIAPPTIPQVESVGIDVRLLGFTFLISLLTGVVFGMAPAPHTAPSRLAEVLKEGTRGMTATRRRRRTRNILVVSEIAVALVLLLGAGLMINSFLRLQRVDPGFDPERVLTMRVSLPAAQYRELTEVTSFYNELLEQIKTLPGVQSVGVATRLPLSGQNSDASFVIESRPRAPGEIDSNSDYRFISPDYFKAMGMRLIKGRSFAESDNESTPGVVIINETAARRYWPGEDPIGKRISDGLPKSPWLTIIGVVGDIKHHGLNVPTRAERYLPYSQMAYSHLGVWRTMNISVRTVSDPQSVIGSIRKLVRSLDGNLPVSNVETMERVISNSVSQPRFTMLLLATFSGIALVLAAVGIYGVMSYSVTQRTHEIGIRMALGGRTVDVLGLVVKNGMMLASTGLVIGLIGAFTLTRLMASLLFEVAPTDAATFAIVSTALLFVALLACCIPAYRATRVDPLVALRSE